MELKKLKEMGPWDWPDDAKQLIVGTLNDKHAPVPDRLMAVELAGSFTVIDTETAGILLEIISNPAELDVVRSDAAISLGPGLETAHICDYDLENEDLVELINDEVPFSMEMYRRIVETLRELYMNEETPREVRRRVLEASVRSPQDWHREAIRSAYEDGDEVWRLTAVFGMEYIRGFDEQILEALEGDNEKIRYHAIRAAGNWEVAGAWPYVTEILDGGEEGHALVMAAIKAAATIRPNEAPLFIEDYLDSADLEIVDTAHEAIGMARGLLDLEDEDNWDDEDDWAESDDGSVMGEPIH